MPILDNPDPHARLKAIAQFYDAAGKRRYKQRIDRLTAELHFITHAGPKSRHELPEMSTKAVTEWWMHQQRKRGCLHDTIEQYKDNFRRLLEAHADDPYGTLATMDFRQLRDDMLDEGYAVRSIRGEAIVLAEFANDAMVAGFHHFNPAATANESLPKPPPSEEIVYPTEKELRDIRLHADPEELVVVDLCAYAAMSLGEITQLRWKDCDLVGGFITVRGTASSVDPEGLLLKHIAPMAPELIASLVRWRFCRPPASAESPVVPTEDGQFHRNSTSALKRHIALPQLRAGILADEDAPLEDDDLLEQGTASPDDMMARRRYRAKDLVHIAATRWIATKGIRVVAEYMGLGVVTIERRYGALYDARFGMNYAIGTPALGANYE